MIIDISVPLRQPMPTYPGDAPFALIPVVRIADGAVCNGSRLQIGTHSGTHIDAPWHFNDAGKRIHEIPLARLIGYAYVADLRGYPAITAEALQAANIPPTTTRLLLKTDNSARWAHATEFHPNHVALTPDAAQWLVRHAVDVVGIDYLSVERYGAPKPEVHHILCGAGKIIIEGLNLNGVEAGEYELLCMPLLIEGADGAPARVALRSLR
ncbi:MAG: cyclase [Armatimonadetes bacterium JP3_11]|jgi:arylformamidase|nr:MAG: cyclase [Armatimonadetes bacterium CP1_7O]OYT75517.1 MAG: cyclase [Armatimonadetes bacterium JP3_11]RMH07885.1 MAG: cyclase family protein [Armatimonadota bacterium]